MRQIVLLLLDKGLVNQRQKKKQEALDMIYGKDKLIKDMKFRFSRKGKKEERTERDNKNIKDAKTITWETQRTSKRVKSVIIYLGNIR